MAKIWMWIFTDFFLEVKKNLNIQPSQEHSQGSSVTLSKSTINRRNVNGELTTRCKPLVTLPERLPSSGIRFFGQMTPK